MHGKNISAPASAKTPEQLTEAYFDHIRTRNWSAIAKLYHPRSLKMFREMLLPFFAAEDGEHLFRSVFGEQSIEAVKGLAPHDFLAPNLQKVLAEKMIIDFRYTTPHILGSVSEGDEIQHVLVRMVTRSGRGFQYAWKVFTFIRNNKDQSWGLLPEGHLMSYIRALIARARIF